MAKKTRASVDMTGDLAVAFLQELGSRVAKGGSSSKSDLARTLIAEALQHRGYDVEAPNLQWGGHTPNKEDDQGQRVAVSAA